MTRTPRHHRRRRLKVACVRCTCRVSCTSSSRTTCSAHTATWRCRDGYTAAGETLPHPYNRRIALTFLFRCSPKMSERGSEKQILTLDWPGFIACLTKATHTYLSIYLSIYLFIYLSIYLSIDLSIYLSIDFTPPP